MWSVPSRAVAAVALAALTKLAPVAGAQPTPDGRVDDLIAQARSRLAAVQTPGAGPRIDLTLDEAVARALERNLDLAVQRLNPQVFDLNLAQQLAAYRPTFDTNFQNNSRTN
ncbi:MAG: hypothetical protein OXQ28_06885, partial [Acidobacteriota bacterium]|nr:hypothetical protein [Acidobacteriota bacterium]